MKPLNLTHLKTFQTVVACGSFSAAAERLSLTQPGVSLQVRQLEKRLGVELVERAGRTVRPTAAGSELLAHAGQIDAAVSSAIEAVEKNTVNDAGRVRLGTGATACIFLLPPILGELRRKFPNLELTVTTGNTPDIIKAIEDNVIDIGFVTLPVKSRSLDVTVVMEDEFVAVARRDMELPKRVTAASLAKLPLLLFEPAGNTRQIVDKWFAASDVTLTPITSLGSTEAIKAMIDAGLGCSILPGMAVMSDKRANRTIRPLSPRVKRQLAVVMRRDKRLTRGLRAMADALLRLRGAT